MLPEEKKKYTYADYAAWDDDGNRYELIDGAVYMMSAPSLTHQAISGEIFRQLANYLDGKSCEVFAAPFDVRLDADSDDDTVVQPDIAVICDSKKTSDRKSCNGAPDMIVEILSPATALYDQNTKFDKYLEAGVKEYWIVNPETQSVKVYLFKNEEGTFKFYKDAAMVPVHVLEDCQINLAKVFPPLPPEEASESSETTAD